MQEDSDTKANESQWLAAPGLVRWGRTPGPQTKGIWFFFCRLSSVDTTRNSQEPRGSMIGCIDPPGMLVQVSRETIKDLQRHRERLMGDWRLLSASWRTGRAGVWFKLSLESWDTGALRSKGRRRCSSREQNPASTAVLINSDPRLLGWRPPLLGRVIFTPSRDSMPISSRAPSAPQTHHKWSTGSRGDP